MSGANLSTKPSVFVLYRDSQLRRAALGAPAGDASRYSLYGLDELEANGFAVTHNLTEAGRSGLVARSTAAMLDRGVRALGGYSGDFAAVLASRERLNRAEVVFSTVDTVGIPLTLLARRGLVRAPIVYAAIGLPERLALLRTARARRLFLAAYKRLQAIVAYGWGEVEALRAWLGEDGPPVEFVPFGVDDGYFRPDGSAEPRHDVVSVGADPRRDFALLVELARRLPERSFHIVASSEHARELDGLPPNVSLDVDVPFAHVRECLLRARLVALPVRENSYSGATTTLLQAMACAKPLVVTRTAAIARGYHLEDRVNCRLVSVGDIGALEQAVVEVLADPGLAAGLGLRARETVEKNLTWTQYTGAIARLLTVAAKARA